MKNTGILFKVIVYTMLFAVSSCEEDVPENYSIGDKYDRLPCPDLPMVMYQGHEYPTIQIGEQCWLKENLNVGQFINGSDQPSDNDTIEKFCIYNKPEQCNQYGGLYSWDELMQYSDATSAQGICPEGWHIPSLNEFEYLMDYTDNNSYYLRPFSKSNVFRENPTGFDAFSTGYKETSPDSWIWPGYGDVFFWLSTDVSETFAERVTFSDGGSQYYIEPKSKNHGFSVRCLKDE